MTYLSPEIEALAKRKETASLVKKENSCGIFQDYGKITFTETVGDNPKQ
ncbi:hypothetical protein I2486_20180 [Cellulophaga sp. E16_2]|uniref:Uncharacterized protein n=1 Tax=Cellulophaga algicola (strain DSM 14237 / IC166 / ACAM 630) TaxID=688270 RepID=E6XEM2_CELAD|nr:MULTISPECIES: hypothetical protein [Cellulophaga]ADV51350.1 hypothetical protein Celal_4108 [Cellulophaga algicola DSM 14237]MBO0593725.1 hypothetical protein [Cellulophaga sp. E16_2]